MSEKFQDSNNDTFENFRIPKSKRNFDIIFSAFIIFITLPISIITAILIKLTSKGPLIYKSKRVGTGYDIFEFYKFRSMYIDAEEKLSELSEMNHYLIQSQHENRSSLIDDSCPECKILNKPCSPILYIDGAEICENLYFQIKKSFNDPKPTFFKLKKDPRVTPLGKILRMFKIDELPQLINVIKGDMSIVGNRPLPLYEAEKLTMDEWSSRFLAPAGITGLWQVSHKKGIILTEEERKKLDNSYANNITIFNDVKLILLTIPAIFRITEK